MQELPQYLAGMQEVLGKTIAFIFTTLLFVVYSFATVSQMIVLTPIQILSYLALFWFLYELFSFIMFLLFSLFLKERKSVAPVIVTKDKADDGI